MKKNSIKNIGYLLFVISLFFLVVFMFYKTRALLDDDVSSDLLLGYLLKENNRFFILPSWNYSTEVKVLTMNTIYSILFRFFDNWFVVRYFGFLITLTTLIIIVYFFCKEYSMVCSFGYIMFCFLLPINYDCLYYNYFGLWYIVYIIKALFILILFKLYSKKNRMIYLMLSSLASIVFCLEGSRLILVLFIPLFLSSVVMMLFYSGKKTEVLFSTINIVSSFIGLYLNKNIILKQCYVPGPFTLSLKPNINNLLLSIKGFFVNHGYSENLIMKIVSLIIVFIIIFSIICIFLNRDSDSLFIALFFIISLMCMFSCLVLTDIPYNDRYLSMVTYFSIFVIFTNLNEKCKTILYLVIICYLICGIKTYVYAKGINKTAEMDYIASNMCEKGYFNGIGFFWYSNVFTELSNGKIDMRCMGFTLDKKDDFKDVLYIFPWLQTSEHYDSLPKGKLFIILSNQHHDRFKDLIWFFDENDILLQTQNYFVYGFDSVDDLKETMRITY